MMTQSEPKPRRQVPLRWAERKAWEEIQHLVETAMKMLEETSTSDLAQTLIPVLAGRVEHLKTVTQPAEESN